MTWLLKKLTCVVAFVGASSTYCQGTLRCSVAASSGCLASELFKKPNTIKEEKMFSFFRRKPKRETQRAKGQEFSIPLLPDEDPFTILSIEEAKKIYTDKKGDYIWLDVRSPKEWNNGHVPGAKHIPIDQLERRVSEVGPTDKKYIVYCQAGGRSTTACEFLSKKGYSSLLNMTGGMGEWDGPVEL